jgi:DNA excision repair protein ERCC-3
MIVLDTSHDSDGDIEEVLRRFSELRSAAGSLHSYRVTDLSLWAAASSGMTAREILELLRDNTSMSVPGDLIRRVEEFMGRYGSIRLAGDSGSYWLEIDDPVLLREIARLLELPGGHKTIDVPDGSQGWVKATLAGAGYPVMDTVRPQSAQCGNYALDHDVILRDYQQQAVERFVEAPDQGGVILLPCGAGKTVVGVAAAARLDARVLIVTPNRTIGEQWAEHFVRMTTLGEEDLTLFGQIDTTKPVNIVTYQALTSSIDGLNERLHEASGVPWGLIIYDEVHTLPADVFRQSSMLQAGRRLGLTATLVREDGREREVFAMVGPPIWQSRWRDLERQGWISPVTCFEIRIRPAREVRNEDQGFAAKLRTVERLRDRHRGDRVLIAAHRINQVKALSNRLGVPAVTGETPQAERARLYDGFRDGSVPVLVVSRVANVGVDLPDANVLIQVSGTFGSRLEEAQRLGRLLRPKQDREAARFYSLVLPDSRERGFAERRQRFLIEQGYRYQVVNARA